MPMLRLVLIALVIVSFHPLHAVAFEGDYNDPQYAVKAWDPDRDRLTTVAELCAGLDDRLGNKETSANEREWVNVLKGRLCPRPALPGEKAIEGFMAPSAPLTAVAESAASVELAILYGLADWAVARAETEFRAWATETMVTRLCDEPVRPYFPNLCARYRTGDPYFMLANAELVKLLRQDLEFLPAALYMAHDPNPNRSYVLANYWREVRVADKAPGQLAAGLIDTPAVIAHCNVQDKSTCPFYFIGLVTRAYLYKPQAGRDRAAVFLARLYLMLANSELSPELKNELQQSLFAFLQEKDRLDEAMQSLAVKLKGLDELIQALKKDAEALKAADQQARIDPTQHDKLVFAAANYYNDAARLVGGVAALFGHETKLKQIDDLQSALLRVKPVSEMLAQAYAGQYAEMRFGLYSAVSCIAGDFPVGPQDLCAPWVPLRAKAGKIRPVAQYAATIIAVAEAKKPEDVERTLDTLAAPAGSWRAKREARMTSFGMLLGAQAGYELLSGENVDQYGGYYAGVFAPVGLDFSWPTKDGRGTRGFFLSIIDIGNLVTTRISGSEDGDVEDTSSEAQVSFAQVLSPGLYWRTSIKGTPWVWGAGVAYTPELRKAQLTTGEEKDLDSFRGMFFFAMDMPIFLGGH